MKKYLIALFACLCVLSSCQIEELTLSKETHPENEKVVYHVGIDVDTRTSFSSEQRILWSEGDKMNIFFGVNNNNKDVLELKEGAGTEYGSFYGPYIAANDLTKLHQTVIVYPFDENNTCEPNADKTAYTIGLTIPAVQKYTEGSIANGSHPMVGVTENTKEVVIKTKNVNTTWCFKIKGNKSIEKIVLSSENPLAGPTQVVASYGNDPVATVVESTAINTVELLCDGVQLSEEVATSFYVTFAPCNGTVTATIYDTEGGYFVGSITKDFRRNLITNTELTYVAQKSVIDDLKTAFKYGGEYTLPMSVSVTDQLWLRSNLSLDLNLNGNTLKMSTSNHMHIVATQSVLKIRNGKLINTNAYALLGTQRFISKDQVLELTDIEVVCDNAKNTSSFLLIENGTNVILNNVNVTSDYRVFSFNENSDGGFDTSMPGITINGGNFLAKGNSNAIIFENIAQNNIPVNFFGDCLFSDKSYAGVQWVDSGNETYPWKPVAHTVYAGNKGFYSIEDALKGTTGDVEIVVMEGEYSLPQNLNQNGESRKVTIKGAGIDVTNLKGSVGQSNNPGNYANDIDLKFENLTLTTANSGYSGGFGHAAQVEFTKCKIVGQYYAHSGAYHKFTDCTIDPLTGYLYTYASDCDFINCDFTASEGKALQVYEDASTGENVVNITDCRFVAAKQAKTWDGKPVTGIDINSNGETKFVVNITNCTTSGFPKGLNSGSDLWNVKNENGNITVVVDDEKVWPIVHFEQDANGNMIVYTEKGLKDALSQAGAAGAGNTTIKLSGDLDMTGVEWTPINVDGYNGADIVTLDGNGAVIKGLTSPLFAGGFAGGSGIVIKNLTIADSQIKSTNSTGLGTFIEASDSQTKIYLEDWNLINSSVEGSRTGGLVGWTSGYNNVNDGPVKSYITFENCSVVGCTIKGSSVGGLNGHAGANAWTYTTINNCTVKDCTLESSDTGEWRVGVAVGTANVGEVSINNLTESNNTLTQTGKTAPEGEKRNYFGRFVPGTTGKLVIDGVNYVGTPADLASALTSDNQEIKVVLMKDIDLPISSLGQITGGSGEYKLGSTSTNKIIIDLNQNRLNITTTYWSAIGAKNDNATITIKNGTMTSTGNSAGTWNAFDMRFSNCNYVIENVDFEKAVALDNAGKKVEMNNVTITETHDYYALWITAEGQNVNISNMTINSDGRGIKIDEQYVGTPEKVYLNVDGLKVSSNKKAAIVVKSIAGADITLSNVDLTEVTADKEYAVWCDEDAAQYANLITVNGGKMKIEGTTPITDGVLINKSGEYELSSKAGLEWLSSQVASGNNFSGKTVKLTTDINLDNVNWSPIGGSDSYTNNFAGTFDGNGKTISNLKVENAKCAGLFGTMTAGTIKNLTISGAKLTTNHYAGAVVAWMEKGAQPFTIDNCHVKNITILVTPDGQPGAYDNGDKAGAVAGFMHYGSITNCTIENANITAYRDLGGVVGYANGATVKDNSVKVATLTVDQLTNYYGDKAVNVGEIIGRRGVNLIESGNIYSSVTIGTKTQQAGNFNKPVVGGDF